MEGEDFAQSADIFYSLPKRNSFFKNELNYGLGSLKTSGWSFNCYSGEESASRYWKRHGCYLPGKNGPGPRPRPAPAGQSQPAALTDGPATRSPGRPASTLRWGKWPERAGAGPALRGSGPLPAHHSRHPRGTLQKSPGSAADALSAMQTLQLGRSPLCTKAPWPEGKARLPSPAILPTPHTA